jgi:hypothetical protein
MESNLKVILLKDRSEYLIGQVTELDEEPSVLVEQCFSISEDESMKPFPAFASQRDLFLTSESILTIVDPSEQIAKEYKAANE